MATTNVRADSASNKPYPNDAHPMEVSPEDVADVYASICKGDCLAPIISDGACLVFSKNDRPQCGDFVGFWLHPDVVVPDELPRRVKRLYMGLGPEMTLPFLLAPGSNAEPLVIFEQINPPKLYYVPASKILAMHKVIGEAQTNGDGTATLVRQFIGGEPYTCHSEEGRTQ